MSLKNTKAHLNVCFSKVICLRMLLAVLGIAGWKSQFIFLFTERTCATFGEYEATEKPHLLLWGRPARKSYPSLFQKDTHADAHWHKWLPVPSRTQRKPLCAYLCQAAPSTGHLRGCGNYFQSSTHIVQPLSHVNTSIPRLHNDPILMVSAGDQPLLML